MAAFGLSARPRSGASCAGPGRGSGGEVVDEALGEAFGGILVSGLYVAYHHYPGLKQRRRAHLLRDIHTLKVLYPENADLVRWAWRVQRLYAKAVGWAAAGAVPHGGSWPWKSGCSSCAGLSWKTRRQSGENCAGGLSGISRACPAHDTGSCSSWFPIRRFPRITMRRSGACATWCSAVKSAAAPVRERARARGLNPLLECRRLLVSPQL